jgi:hypothetical protein
MIRYGFVDKRGKLKTPLFTSEARADRYTCLEHRYEALNWAIGTCYEKEYIKEIWGWADLDLVKFKVTRLDKS